MCEAGFSAGDAIRAMMVMSHYVVGSVIEEQSAADAARGPVEQGFAPDRDAYPDLWHGVSLLGANDPAIGFEFGLDALVKGLSMNRDAAHGTSNELDRY